MSDKKNKYMVKPKSIGRVHENHGLLYEGQIVFDNWTCADQPDFTYIPGDAAVVEAVKAAPFESKKDKQSFKLKAVEPGEEK